jgi:hypothetical protein
MKEVKEENAVLGSVTVFGQLLPAFVRTETSTLIPEFQEALTTLAIRSLAI